MKLLLIASMLASFMVTDGDTTKLDHKWLRIPIQDETRTIYVDSKSINFQKDDSEFTFVVWTIFKEPIHLKGVQVTSYFTFNRISCETQESQILSDILLDGVKPVAENALSKLDEPTEPAPGTVHSILMNAVCKAVYKAKKNIIHI